MTRSLGQWQAYAEAGETREDRKARMEEAPEEMRARILDHMQTVFALKRKAAEKGLDYTLERLPIECERSIG